MAGPSTAGLAALQAGEDWHYVGEAGEPAFENGWGNKGVGQPALAFRIREVGVVDIQGQVAGGTSGTTIFTLPTGYRPSAISLMPGVGYASGAFVAVEVNVTSGGLVRIQYSGTLSNANIYVQMFLEPPAVV